MLHVTGQAWYVGGWGVFQGVLAVVPVYMLEGVCEEQTGENAGCSKTEPLELDHEGKVRKDRIRG